MKRYLMIVLGVCLLGGTMGCVTQEARPLEVWELVNGKSFLEGAVRVQGSDNAMDSEGYLRFTFVLKNMTVQPVRIRHRFRYFDDKGYRIMTHHGRRWEVMNLDRDEAKRIEGKSPMKFAKKVSLEVR